MSKEAIDAIPSKKSVWKLMLGKKESAMTGSKIQSFDLFKAAMGNQEFLAEINKDKINQTFF